MTTTNEPEFRNCRAPHCNFKAPVCQYGYCGACCLKHHNYASIGYTSNHQPPSESGGFRIIERGGPAISRALVPVTSEKEDEKPPECGSLDLIDNLEFPLEDNASGYNRSI